MRRPLSLTAVLVVLGLAAAVSPAYANRFGPPWQSRVVVDRTIVLAQADRAAAVVGPLVRGQIVVVIGETRTRSCTRR